MLKGLCSILNLKKKSSVVGLCNTPVSPSVRGMEGMTELRPAVGHASRVQANIYIPPNSGFHCNVEMMMNWLSTGINDDDVVLYRSHSIRAIVACSVRAVG